jgi:hypothetical protein
MGVVEDRARRGERGGPDRAARLLRRARGRPWTLFAWSRNGGPGITFYNVANDYPQRIRYWREGDVLIAEIALEDGSKPKRWRYRKVRR